MTVEAHRPPVIVVGGDVNALSVGRSIGALGVPVYGLGVPDYVGHSRFVKLLPVPAHGPGAAAREHAWAACLLGQATEHLHGAVVLAADDVGITVLARHRDELSRRFLLDDSHVPAQTAMLDKLSTYEIAVEAGVPTPRFWRLDDPGDLDRYRDELIFPLIVKPLRSHEYTAAFPGLTKFRIAEDSLELLTAYRELAAAGVGVLLVEHIPGADDLLCSYYTYLDSSGSPTFDFTKRILRRHPPGMGVGCYHVTDWNPEVRDAALRLFKHAGLRGVANAEFKRDVRDGQLKLIECNARFTAGNCVVVSAGIDLAQHVYLRILGENHELPQQYRIGVRLLYPSVDLRSFLALRRTGELDLVGWLRSLAHPQTFPVLRWDDPVPALARGATRLRRCIARAGDRS